MTLEKVSQHLMAEEGATRTALGDWTRARRLRLLSVAVLVALFATQTTAFGGSEESRPSKPGDRTPTFSPTTSQPTGYKAPSVPGEVLDVPLVDLTARPTAPLSAKKNGAAEAASRYADLKKSGDIAGAVNVNEEAREETTTAMNAVAYIFMTFVGLLAMIGAVLYRTRTIK